MLKKVIITNYLGETAEYKIEGVQSDDESGLFITSVDGLGPVKANINMMDLATTDGQLYNSARLSGRNIVIKALFTEATSIEEARLLSYKYFPIKSKVNIKIVTDKRTAETNGYVESNEPDIFSEREGCQISILCENPYFDGGKVEYVLGDTDPLFKFEFGNASLDEPLIKISESIDASEPKQVIYEGDADTGMEIEVSVPSDDILDTFKVTGIEIQGSDGKIKIDTSKMVNQVPNTAPNEFPRSECLFILNDEKYKFLQRLSDKIERGSSHRVIYKNELHIFYPYFNTSNDIYAHIKLDEETKKWIKLPDTSGIHQITWIVNLNDTLYAYTIYSEQIFILNEETNTWELNYDRPPIYTGRSNGHLAAVIGNYIHCFDSSGDPGSASTSHYRYDGNSWERIGDMSFLGGGAYNLYDSLITSDGEYIYILGGGASSGSITHRRDMYMYHNNTWTTFADNLPIISTGIHGACIYKNRLHIIASDNHYSCEAYTNNPVWIQEYSVPYGFEIAAFNDYMYSVGGYDQYTYTEEANNIKLIENDKLVVNTNKGKKSVTLYRDGNKYNVLNSLEKGSTWLQLHRGVNGFSYSAETGLEDMQVKLITNKWYEGV